MTKYNLESSDSLFIVKTPDSEKTLQISDLYTYDYSTYEQIDKTEEALTNAIVELTIDKKPKIYILTGKTYYNTEKSLADIIQKLNEDSNQVEYLDILSKGKVPEDCDCLVITTLSTDISELERDQILAYIKNGGKIMMLTSQNLIETDTPNFDKVLAEYGITLDYGVVIEQDTSKMLSNSPEYIISEVNADFMSDIDMNIKMCVIDAGKIKFADSEQLEKLGVEYETLASTSEKSFVRTNFNINGLSRTAQDGEEEASINIINPYS